jgi:hypothetical protein
MRMLAGTSSPVRYAGAEEVRDRIVFDQSSRAMSVRRENNRLVEQSAQAAHEAE